MMVLLFLLITISFFLAWKGNYQLALLCFLVFLFLCVYWLYHHISDPLNIQL